MRFIKVSGLLLLGLCLLVTPIGLTWREDVGLVLVLASTVSLLWLFACGVLCWWLAANLLYAGLEKRGDQPS